ncbi:alcohol dehydrogenase catalytic domain-containing protein [Amycolatopsis jejuensis]|uniref:alcohol dehydrogenase catalytic domain-containing protein n=1 Tax=Amycolatopsis jejuensis TaxID=330084 RepID=UPI0005254346|nr:alcohol dehydrogenase catalytic domain-containing protein [Amycolatopsis jejuensis]
MRALSAVALAPDKFDIVQLQVESPAPDEIVVEMRAAGVCHTDADELAVADTPYVMGHEGAGVVREVGAAVEHVAVGDRVLLTWAIACGTCRQCSRGAATLCERYGYQAGHARPGSTRDERGASVGRSFSLGTMAEVAIVRREAVVKLPEDIPLASACLLGCAVMTGFGSVVNAAKVGAGSTVVVLGCGGVGLNVVQAARIVGAARIVAVDIEPSRLEMAVRMGATDPVLAPEDDRFLAATAEEVTRMLGGGADYAFECSGVPDLGLSPLRFVRNGGTAVPVSGVESVVEADLSLFEWDKTYLTPLYGQCRPGRDFPRLFELYRRGLLLLDELVTHRYSLIELPAALADLAGRRTAKGVVVL